MDEIIPTFIFVFREIKCNPFTLIYNIADLNPNQAALHIYTSYQVFVMSELLLFSFGGFFKIYIYIYISDDWGGKKSPFI